MTVPLGKGKLMSPGLIEGKDPEGGDSPEVEPKLGSASIAQASRNAESMIANATKMKNVFEFRFKLNLLIARDALLPTYRYIVLSLAQTNVGAEKSRLK